MTATDTMTPEQQYRLVYEGITAVAARCDGAIDDDGVGFNGQDTKFGKRIASVPFEEWTPEIREEAARIANRYQAQIERYTGVDITALPVVKAAQGLATSHGARDQARNIERNQGAVHQRIARVEDDGSVRLAFPYDRGLVDAVRDLPGRKWDPVAKVWTAPPSQALADFIERNRFHVFGEIVVPEPVEAPEVPTQASQADIDAWNAKVAAERNQVTLEGGRVRIRFDYDPAKVAAVRSLPGRQYDGATKSNTADLHPDVLRFADEYGLAVADEVRTALQGAESQVSAEEAERALRQKVSGMANPADLPAEFVQRVLAACPKAEVV